MTRQIDFAGASGSVYRYSSIEEERHLPPAGANYVIAQVQNQAARILFAGETERLSDREWEAALATVRAELQQQRAGDAEVFTRLNVRSAVRRAEREDLIQAHAPPLNAAETGAG